VLDGSGRIAGLVAVVTPCLNGGLFLQKTIDSILAQTYDRIDYVVVDGGSSDRSLAIARGYGDRVRVVVVPGSTQTEAANAGFRESRAEFFSFVNADDVLKPTAITEMVAALEMEPRAPYVYADADFIGVDDEFLGSYPTRDFDLEKLAESCYVCQPATLVRADAFAAAGGLRERYDAAFDYDLWMRFAHTKPPPVRIKRVLAKSRMHYGTKTYRTRRRNFREIRAIVRSHYGYVPFSWIHAYAGIRVSDSDMFFDPPRGSFQRTLLTLAIGLGDNRTQPVRFLREFVREVVRLRREKRRGEKQ
jgi:glycosyltransferase involved in cell wall biosynthesis